MATNTVRLPVVFCLLVDFPHNENNSDCGMESGLKSFEAPRNICFKCPIAGRYLTGDTLDDHGSAGHVIGLLLWILIVIVGTFGTCTNCLIISIMRKHKDARAFDFLLIVLASCDLLGSVCSVLSATSMITYFEDWDRGPITLYVYYLPFLLCLLGRSGSTYMTVLITIERYLVIAQPLRTSTWFTNKKTKILAICVVILAILVNIPRLSSLTVDHNYSGMHVASLSHLKYIIHSTPLEEVWYKSLKSVHYQFDMWVPFPILVIFNTLLFFEIKKFMRRRQDLNKKKMQDIRAARMFVPVVIVLFLCNIEPITHYIVLHFTSVYYRELVLGLTLSISVNSAANLPIYYARGSSFRKEIQAALPDWCGYFKKHRYVPGEISMTTGKNTGASGSSANVDAYQ